MKGIAMKKGIIFDMDGTLWDSAENVAASWNLAIDEYVSGMSEAEINELGMRHEPITVEDMYSVMGKTMDKIAEILFPNMQIDQRTKLLELCCIRENGYLSEHGGLLYPNVKETVEKLKDKYHVYIVSNCQAGYIEAFLKYYGYEDLFEDIECYGNNNLQKADNIALVVKRNNLDEAVYVGDIQGDYDSSMAAGVKFIHAAYGFGTINADVEKIDEFSQLVYACDKVL